MSKVNLVFRGLLVPLSFIVFNPSTSAADCGPGPHWVDKCPKGTDNIKNHWATMKLEITGPDGTSEIIPLESLQGSPQFKVYRGNAETGPVSITAPPVPTVPPTPSEIGQETFGPIEPPPDPPAPHDPHQGVIQTEIISLVFKGKTTALGDIVIRAGDEQGNLENDGPLYSPGIIYEDSHDATNACSVFFVTYEILVKKTEKVFYGQGRMSTCNEEPGVRPEKQAILTLPPKQIEYKDPRKRPIFNKKGEIIGWVYHKHPVINLPPPPQGCVCGPGFNWWENCPAGTDSSQSTAVLTIEIPCGGQASILYLSGKTVIDRSAWGDEGIKLSMSSMVLKNPPYTVFSGSDYNLSALGSVTPGSSPWLANIAFNIFFEINTPLGKLHNQQPHIMGTTAYCLPPIGEIHIPPTGAPPTMLYNENNQPVACIVGAQHELDVELEVPLQAKVKDNTVTLKWKTAYEHDVVGFTIKRKEGSGERCRSTLGYESISGILPSRGEGSSYTFSDNLATMGNYCYQLLEVNDSGNTVPISSEHQADLITSVKINQ